MVKEIAELQKTRQQEGGVTCPPSSRTAPSARPPRGPSPWDGRGAGLSSAGPSGGYTRPAPGCHPGPVAAATLPPPPRPPPPLGGHIQIHTVAEPLAPALRRGDTGC